MTNIIKNPTSEKMRTHFEKTFDLLDDFLPKHYVKEVIDIMEKEGIETTSNIVRNVKNQRTTTNLLVLNALVKVAEKYRGLENELISK